MNIINDLKDRGILKDITNIEKFQNIDSQALFILVLTQLLKVCI